jgi:hypothetical protein
MALRIDFEVVDGLETALGQEDVQWPYGDLPLTRVQMSSARDERRSRTCVRLFEKGCLCRAIARRNFHYLRTIRVRKPLPQATRGSATRFDQESDTTLRGMLKSPRRPFSHIRSDVDERPPFGGKLALQPGFTVSLWVDVMTEAVIDHTG